MSLPMNRREAIGVAVGSLALSTLAHAERPGTKILIVSGPSSHPPGTHEVAAGCRLLKHCLDNANLGMNAEVISEWPKETPSGFASVVFIGDMFPAEVMKNRDTIMADLTKLMKAGTGMVCIHYATGLEAKHVSETGDHPLLHWLGGYFATRCNHHRSVAKVFASATVDPAAKDHPINRGWKSFTFHDEPYIENYFGKDGPAKNVMTIATSMLPPEKPEKQPITWAIQRDDGGRGVGVVMPHFYRNWKLDDLRTLILNAIVWTSHIDVPKDGVQVKLPELELFKPAAVEPVVKKK